MVDVETEIVISRDVAAVAEYSGDPSHAPDWYVNIETVDWLGEPVLEIGSQMEFQASFLGRRLRYVYKIVDLVPGERLVMSTMQGPFPMETTYTWAAVGDRSTRMTLRNRGEPRGFSKLVAPFMTWAMRRANRKDLARLKAIIEGS